MNLAERVRVIPRKLLGDDRGALLKVMKGDEPGLTGRFGEIYVVWAKDGKSRGGHFHPKTGEWFTLLEGHCRLVAVDMQDGERREIDLSEAAPVTIHMPAGVAHRFDSIDGPWSLLAYAANPYDPSDTVMFDCGPNLHD